MSGKKSSKKPIKKPTEKESFEHTTAMWLHILAEEHEEAEEDARLIVSEIVEEAKEVAEKGKFELVADLRAATPLEARKILDSLTDIHGFSLSYHSSKPKPNIKVTVRW